MLRYYVSEVTRTYRPMRTVDSCESAADLFRRQLAGLDRERLYCALMDTRNGVIGIELVSIGGLDAAFASPREILKPAILQSAAGIIVAHNHPSGDPTPTVQDRAMTERLDKACKLFDVRLLDHIIIGADGAYASLRVLGVIA